MRARKNCRALYHCCTLISIDDPVLLVEGRQIIQLQLGFGRPRFGRFLSVAILISESMRG
jgi:hypothetical protein